MLSSVYLAEYTLHQNLMIEIHTRNFDLHITVPSPNLAFLCRNLDYKAYSIMREDWACKRALETPCHARISPSPQDPTAMFPDLWSKLTWDTSSAGGYDLFDPIGYLDRKRDRAYKQRVIVTPANVEVFTPCMLYRTFHLSF